MSTTETSMTAVYEAILDACEAGDTGLGGYPTILDIEDRVDLQRKAIREATYELARRDRIHIGTTLADVRRPGSHVATYVPQRDDGGPTSALLCPGCEMVLTPMRDGRRFECRNSHCPESVWKPEEVIPDV